MPLAVAMYNNTSDTKTNQYSVYVCKKAYDT